MALVEVWQQICVIVMLEAVRHSEISADDQCLVCFKRKDLWFRASIFECTDN